MVCVMTPTKRLPTLPAERAIKVIAGRWKPLLLYRLFDGPMRLGTLHRLFPGLSQKVLIQQLREMEEHGLVFRTIRAEVPARVDYDATEMGRSLEPILLALCEWGRRHARALDRVDAIAGCPASRPPQSERIAAGADATLSR